MPIHLDAVWHAVRRLPAPYIAARVLRKLGVQAPWLRRTEFMQATDARTPARVVKILIGAMRNASLDPTLLVRGAQNKHVLEIGCGRHIGFAALAALAGARGYIGIDPSLEPDTLAHPRIQRDYIARALADQATLIRELGATPKPDVTASDLLANAALIRGGIADIASPEEPIGLCLSISCLEHIQDFEEAVHTIARLSNPETMHVHLVNFSNHLSKANPFVPLYDSPYSTFKKKWGPIINGHRISDLQDAFTKAGVAMQVLPLDVRADALPQEIDGYWTARYSNDELAVRTALVTNLAPIPSSNAPVRR